jgi:hypothetical protein
MKQITTLAVSFFVIFLASACYEVYAANSFQEKLNQALQGNKQQKQQVSNEQIMQAIGESDNKIVYVARSNINTKITIGGSYSSSVNTDIKTSTYDIPASLSLEYMHHISQIFKIGGGAQYAVDYSALDSQDMYDESKKNTRKYVNSFVPVYFSFQINPTGNGVFFNANIGYSVFYDGDKEYFKKTQGGLYWALGGGYEDKSGLILGALYQVYSYSLKESTVSALDISRTIGHFSIVLGYKFDPSLVIF